MIYFEGYGEVLRRFFPDSSALITQKRTEPGTCADTEARDRIQFFQDALGNNPGFMLRCSTLGAECADGQMSAEEMNDRLDRLLTRAAEGEFGE